MRVALATYSTRPRGGVVHTLALAEALASLGHDVTVWTLARGGDAGFFRPVDPTVTVQAVPFADREDESVGRRILRSIDALRAAFRDAGGFDASDVVHAEDCISANAIGPGCLRTVHHVDRFTTPELVACHDRAIVEPRALVCVSSAVAAEVAVGWGRTATVIPNGVDAARFDAASAAGAAAAARDAWRSRLDGDPLVVTLGGIEPRKGTIDLLRAVVLLRRTRTRVRLAIGGGETLFDHRDYRMAFDAEAAATDAPVTVLGPLPHDDVPPLVAVADVFAFPSTKEGFGLAAMEALAAGVPVVVRDLPVLREVFGDAVTYATDPGSLAAALAEAADAPDPARVAAGLALARAHTWRAAAERHVALYESLA